MFGVDLTTVLVIIGAAILLFLLLDFLFAGGGMTSAMTGAAAQCGAAALGSPYGWALIVTLVILALAAFEFLFGYR